MCIFYFFEGNYFFLNENIEEIVNSIKRKLDFKRLLNSF